jgi:hypothetical protein
MGKAKSVANQTNIQEIQHQKWISYLAEFTREYRGAHARLEIIGAGTDVGYQVETEDRPLDGVSADVKDRESTVWIAFGSTAEDHLTHSVVGATAIRVIPPTEGRGAVMEIEAADGTKSILYLTAPGEYAL